MIIQNILRDLTFKDFSSTFQALFKTDLIFKEFHFGYLKTGTLTNSEDPDEMMGLHCV